MIVTQKLYGHGQHTTTLPIELRKNASVEMEGDRRYNGQVEDTFDKEFNEFCTLIIISLKCVSKFSKLILSDTRLSYEM